MFPDLIDRLEVGVYTVPTPEPESDGTLEWDATTIVVVELGAGNHSGVGYAYTASAAASVVRDTLADLVIGSDVLANGSTWTAMVAAVRNLGRPGIASSAIAAVDIALWDLKATFLGISVADALGRFHVGIPAYGSGGFTSLDDAALVEQLEGWATQGLPAVKMKVGRDPARDRQRVSVARRAIGDVVGLMVDANGAYTRKQALAFAQEFSDRDVTWFEEPVSSDDLEGLRLIRDTAPAGVDITAGEYGYDLPYFRAMLEAGSVDCLQADVTRCGGISGFVQVGALADARSLDLSAHTAPLVSAHACCGLRHVRHLEWFADHVRIESMLFDGVRTPRAGVVEPDLSAPGLGVEFKRNDAERFRDG